MIKLVNVSKYYSTNNVVALGLRKVNLELYRNEFVAIVGESGSGKTTLLNVISGIDSYEDGEMYVNGKETSYFSVSDMENYRKKYVAFVFQNYNLIDSYTVLQNVEAPLILSGYPEDKIKDRAKAIIKKVGLEDHTNHKATKLSGGQKQRVVIARALAKDCPIIAADEPTGNLDSKSAKQIIELLHDISKEKLVIIVTHDFNQVKDYATRKIRIFDGEVVEDLKITKVKKLELPEIPDEDRQIKFRNYLKISFRNLMSVPKKTILMFLVFTFFSFFIALSYGAYQLAMQEVSYNQNYHFENTNPNRIVIKKRNNEEFSIQELADLADNNLVSEVVPFDYVLDASAYLISTVNESMSMGGLFLPVSLITLDDLDYGVMPEDETEIVVALNSRIIDGHVDDILDVEYTTNRFTLKSKTYTVVGIIDVSKLVTSPDSYYEAYYLLNEAGMDKLRVEYYISYTLNSRFVGVEDDLKSAYLTLTNKDYVIDDSIPDNQINYPVAYYNGICLDVCTAEGNLNISDYYRELLIEDFNIVYDSEIINTGEIRMNQNTYDLIFYDEIYQVSILTRTDVGVPNLVSSLQRESDSALGLKYNVVYPYDSNTEYDFEALVLLMMNIGFIALIFITLLGSTLITYVIFRAIINTKLHDYAIFRTIGANKKVIKSFIYLENLFIVLASYIVFVVVAVSIPISVARFGLFQALKIYNFGNFIVFFFLLVIMSLIISRKYCNRIFRDSVQSTLKSDMG